LSVASLKVHRRHIYFLYGLESKPQNDDKIRFKMNTINDHTTRYYSKVFWVAWYRTSYNFNPCA